MTLIIVALLSVLVAVAATVVIRRRNAPKHRAPRARGFLAVASGLGAGVVIAVSTAGATYAYLNAQTSTGAATIQSGTIGLTVGSIPTISNLLPGESAQQTVTVTSTGHAPVDATVRVSTANGMSVHVAQGACGTASTPVTSTPVSIGSFAAGQTRSFCIRITAPTTGHAESSSYPVVLTFDSVQNAG